MVEGHILLIQVYKITALRGKQIDVQKYSHRTQLQLIFGAMPFIEILTIKWQHTIMYFHLVGVQ